MKARKIKTDRSHYLFTNQMLVSLIIPLIVEQLLAVLVGMADSIMIASVGEAAVSGVSLVDSVMLLLINIFAALATGGAVVAGQYLGQKNTKKACEASDQLVWFVTVIALVIMAFLYLGKSFILHTVFGKIDADVMEHANIYLIIVSASIPFIAIYNAGAAIFRSMGNSKVSMKVSIIMNIINVSGNAILIYGFHRGTEGVAIPTLVSRIVAAVLITILLCNETLPLHINKSLNFHFRWNVIKKILHIGIPNGLENSMFQLGKIIVLSLVSTFGTFAIAANAVSNVLAAFEVLPGMAVSLAITTVIAQCVGAGDYEQVIYYTKKLLIIVYACIFVTVAITLGCMPVVLKAYNLSAATAAETMKIMVFHSACACVIWPLSFALPATFRASGDVRFSMMSSIISMWICRIIFSYILGKYLGLGVFGVWVAMVLDWCVRMVCFFIRYKSGRWKGRAVV
ncbi:MATE family efflux transporter [Clostridium sp. AM58-1XD]|uniref:MATE family efflux transporter n=1 Tax=Clostridium sp. AM58-1XD TaxID=2292307 RepID=UPI000E49BD93|nr:MATE family efflux transporter [Clostridium sp. AM58-1XD]RGZ01810.1 MATE family efflux transporter [Clostridium sp. AM58-1XD]